MRNVAMITGGSRGLGATLAGFLARAGWDLVLTARGAEALDSTAEALRAHGGRVEAVPGDVSDSGHRRRLADAARAAGGLDWLVNNASELGPSPLPPLVEATEGALERAFAVNVVAPLALVRETLPLLEARGGLVVNVSSDAAVGGYPGWGVYGATKAALDLAGRTLAAELGERGVAVVGVDPGDMRTAMHQAAFPDEDISDRPEPEATLPFWAWLLGRERSAVTGRRFRAQADRWEVAA